MTKKNNTRRILYFGAVIVVLPIISFGIFKSLHQEVTFTTPDWNCTYSKKQWECQVKFELTNQTHKNQKGKLSIRGMAMKKADRRFSNLSERKTIDFDLNDYETKEIVEIVYSKRKPNFMNITIIERDKNI